MTLKRTQLFFVTVIVLILLTALCACSNSGQSELSISPTQTEAPTASTEHTASPEVSSTPVQQPDEITGSGEQSVITGEVIITFDYEKQSGSASNQFAVWIEDMDGNYLNTLYATKWTANGGYESRPDSVALWVAKSGIASMPDYYVDAVSGATPRSSGNQSYTWNLKDINGDTVPPGEYKFFVEGTLRWKNFVLYSGVIEIGDNPSTVQAVAEFTYEGSDRYAVLSEDSPENNMIGAVTARFSPIP